MMRHALVTACLCAAACATALAQDLKNGVIVMEVPQDTQLLTLKKFAYPSATGSYQADEVVLCYDQFNGDVPGYVRGQMAGYFYFEGAITPGKPSTLQLFFNTPETGKPAASGSVSVKFASDYLSAEITSVNANPRSWTAYWPKKWNKSTKATEAEAAKAPVAQSDYDKVSEKQARVKELMRRLAEKLGKENGVEGGQ